MKSYFRATETDHVIKPIRQRKRIIMLRTHIALSFILFFLVVPSFYETKFGTLLLIFGTVCIVISALGRCWAILHIGSRKNVELIQSGPYKYCRNPLYLFSIVGTLGFGLSTKSIIFSIGVLLPIVIIFLRTIKKEEQYLLFKFKGIYDDYKAEVPCLIPRFRINAKYRNKSPRGKKNIYNNINPLLESLSILLLIPFLQLIQEVKHLFNVNAIVLP